MKRLHDVLRFHFLDRPKHTAVIDQDRRLSYEELWNHVCSVRRWLVENFEPQTRIGIMLPNSLEMVMSLYGISAAGMTSVPLDADMHPRNMEYIIEDGGIPLVITSAKVHHRIRKMGGSKRASFLLVDGSERHSAFASPRKKALAADKEPDGLGQEISPSNIASILYTTGTTGPKKGVMLSHFNLLSATKNINQFMGIGPDVVESLPMRLSHSFGFARLRCVFDVGGTAVLENGFLRPERILVNMKKTGANALASVPSGFAILLETFGEFFKSLAPRIRHIEIGSDFMPLQHKMRLMELCPRARICLHYGLTEASRATFLDFHLDREHLETVGKASPNVAVKIVDDSGKELGAKRRGEILVKGDMVMVGYWGKPEWAQKTLADGWLPTGDLGSIDESGYLHLIGRKEELLNIGGFKVAPAEIEEVLLRFGGILDAAVIKSQAPEEGFSGGTKALIVVDKKSNFKNTDLLKTYCLKELEAYKVPNEFEIVDKLPRSLGAGKKRP